MNIQQIVQRMNKMQKEYEKKKAVLDEQEFTYTANGAIEVTLKGDYSLVGIKFIDQEILKEDPEMVQDMTKLAFDGAKDAVDEAGEKLAESLQKSAGVGGMPF